MGVIIQPKFVMCLSFSFVQPGWRVRDHRAAVPDATAEDLLKVLDKTKGLRLMGQRFIPDSHMFQNLVLPVVQQYTGKGQPFTWELTEMGPARVFPRGLDVMAVLGSEAALGLLDREGDTDYLDYDKTLNRLIAQFRAFGPADWMRNLY